MKQAILPFKSSLPLPYNIPSIIVAEKGLFAEWLRNNERLGGQYKVPRLDDSSKIFSDIMKLKTTY